MAKTAAVKLDYIYNVLCDIAVHGNWLRPIANGLGTQIFKITR